MAFEDLDYAGKVNFVINVYINSIFCVFGFVGNTLALIVFARERSKTSNTIFLQALAVFDLLFLVYTVLYTVLRNVYPATGHLELYYYVAGPYLIAWVLPTAWIAQCGTVWFTTLVAGDRFLAVSRPFTAARISTLRNARIITVLTSIVALLYNIPRFVYYGLLAFETDTNITYVGHIIVDIDGFNSQLYHYLYHITLTLIFVYLIPLTLLCVFDIKLIVAFRRATSVRNRMLSMQQTPKQQRYNVTVTLNVIIIIGKFILCETPEFLAALRGIVPETIDSHNWQIYMAVKQMLLVFNSSVNFYIYCLVNVKFRQILKNMCSCCCCYCCACCCCKCCKKHHNTLNTVSRYSTHDIPAHVNSYAHARANRAHERELRLVAYREAKSVETLTTPLGSMNSINEAGGTVEELAAEEPLPMPVLEDVAL